MVPLGLSGVLEQLDGALETALEYSIFAAQGDEGLRVELPAVAEMVDAMLALGGMLLRIHEQMPPTTMPLRWAAEGKGEGYMGHEARTVSVAVAGGRVVLVWMEVNALKRGAHDSLPRLLASVQLLAVMDKMGRLIASDQRAYHMRELSVLAMALGTGAQRPHPELSPWLELRAIELLRTRDRILAAKEQGVPVSPKDLSRAKGILDVSIRGTVLLLLLLDSRPLSLLPQPVLSKTGFRFLGRLVKGLSDSQHDCGALLREMAPLLRSHWQSAGSLDVDGAEAMVAEQLVSAMAQSGDGMDRGQAEALAAITQLALGPNKTPKALLRRLITAHLSMMPAPGEGRLEAGNSQEQVPGGSGGEEGALEGLWAKLMSSSPTPAISLCAAATAMGPKWQGRKVYPELAPLCSKALASLPTPRSLGQVKFTEEIIAAVREACARHGLPVDVPLMVEGVYAVRGQGGCSCWYYSRLTRCVCQAMAGIRSAKIMFRTLGPPSRLANRILDEKGWRTIEVSFADLGPKQDEERIAYISEQLGLHTG